MKVLFSMTFLICIYLHVFANTSEQNKYVSTNNGKDFFALYNAQGKSSLLINSADYAGVIRAYNDLQVDIFKVTGEKPELFLDEIPSSKNIIIAGTLGKSDLIDKLIAKKMIDPSELEGKWEKFIIKTVKKPFPGIDNALVIAGSDKRGTIYGIYDLSEKIGVSPWYYWTDVPVQKKENIYIKP